MCVEIMALTVSPEAHLNYVLTVWEAVLRDLSEALPPPGPEPTAF